MKKYLADPVAIFTALCLGALLTFIILQLCGLV